MSVTAVSDQIPDRTSTQDEGIVLIVLRREDPVNPGGDASPDLGNALSQPVPEFAAAVKDFCVSQGFDPAISYVTVAHLTDVESSGAITVDQFVDIPPAEPTDPPVEDPEV